MSLDHHAALDRARRAGHPVDPTDTVPGPDPAGPGPRLGRAPDHRDEPAEPAVAWRLIPRTGDDIVFCLLGFLLRLRGEVPVGRDRRPDRARTATCSAGCEPATATPDDRWPGPLPAEFELDPGPPSGVAEASSR